MQLRICLPKLYSHISTPLIKPLQDCFNYTGQQAFCYWDSVSCTLLNLVCWFQIRNLCLSIMSSCLVMRLFMFSQL